jgi:predicted RNase H-like HicB family nuclease
MNAKPGTQRTNGNGHAPAAAPRAARRTEGEPGEAEYLVIVHPAGDLDAPHLARYWTEVPALSACTGDGATVDQAVENTRREIARWLQAQAALGPPRLVPPFSLSVQLAF